MWVSGRRGGAVPAEATARDSGIVAKRAEKGCWGPHLAEAAELGAEGWLPASGLQRAGLGREEGTGSGGGTCQHLSASLSPALPRGRQRDTWDVAGGRTQRTLGTAHSFHYLGAPLITENVDPVL